MGIRGSGFGAKWIERIGPGCRQYGLGSRAEGLGFKSFFESFRFHSHLR